MKSAWESNIEALIHPETGLAAVVRKLVDRSQPFKEAFLKRTFNMSFTDYMTASESVKSEIQTAWIASEELQQSINQNSELLK